jgi:hypothetical protein
MILKHPLHLLVQPAEITLRILQLRLSEIVVDEYFDYVVSD